MDELTTFRILLLGKSGNGKSSLANIIFGETMFKVKKFNDMNTSVSEAGTKRVNGRSLTLIDTPGLFDPGRSEDEAKPELVRCIAECAPGPHVFLIVLKVERYTEQEQAIVNKMCQYFSGDALKYAAVVFTHGDQLPEGMKIDEYVDKSTALSELVKECGGRCHVFDCRYWKNNTQENYRSNQFQVAELLNTIDKILLENTSRYYTNAVLDEMERGIEEEMQRIKGSLTNMSEVEIRKQAKSNILQKVMMHSAWIKGLTVAAAGLLAVGSALFVKSRFGQTITEAPLSSLRFLNQGAIKTGAAMVESLVEAGEHVAQSATSQLPLDDVGPLVEQGAIKTGAAMIESLVEAGEHMAQSATSQFPVPNVGPLVEKGAQNTVFDILDKLYVLFERTYNPFNPFE